MRNYGKPPTADEIAKQIGLFLDRKITRRKLYQWSREKNISENTKYPYGALLKDHVARLAFSAVYAAITNDIILTEKGPPYFIRERDYKEWLASIKSINRTDEVINNLYSIRPHQLKPFDPKTYFSIRVTPSEIEDNCGIKFIRSLDDLDYFEESYLEDKDGLQFILTEYKRSPEMGLIVQGEPDIDKAKLDQIISLFPDKNLVWY